LAPKVMKCVDAAGTVSLKAGNSYSVREYGDSKHVEVFLEGEFRKGWLRSRFVDVTSEPGYVHPDALEMFRKATEKPVSAKDTQIGGTHYTKLAIQPFEYANANNMGPCEFTALGYITRWKDKGGVEDLKKAIHAIQWLIEWTEKNPES
jgi:hypothetical protein